MHVCIEQAKRVKQAGRIECAPTVAVPDAEHAVGARRQDLDAAQPAQPARRAHTRSARGLGGLQGSESGAAVAWPEARPAAAVT